MDFLKKRTDFSSIVCELEDNQAVAEHRNGLCRRGDASTDSFASALAYLQTSWARPPFRERFWSRLGMARLMSYSSQSLSTVSSTFGQRLGNQGLDAHFLAELK